MNKIMEMQIVKKTNFSKELAQKKVFLFVLKVLCNGNLKKRVQKENLSLIHG